MERYPAVPAIEDAPAELLSSGHLWLVEKVAGEQVRFRMEESGLVQFGDSRRVYAPDEVPDSHAAAAEHVRANLARDALRDAVSDASTLTFFGETPDDSYDPDTPPFLGFDVHVEGSGFRPPDAVERAFEAFGLDAVHAFAREVHTRDFDPAGYEIPESAYRDGPAAGVVVRNKRGQRAQMS